MQIEQSIKPRRGRPAKSPEDMEAMRATLIRNGMELLTERGYSSTGIDAILKPAGVPKGSFYYYFSSKEQFIGEVIDAYSAYFAQLLDRYLLNTAQTPLKRIQEFVEAASAGMARFNYKRGCLVGNLGQEMSTLPEVFRFQIESVFADWESRLAQCLRDAQQQGEISPSANPQMLAYIFWIGWEGAVLRAKLEQTDRPMKLFAQEFLNTNRHTTQP
jgi:TetR/AcrR family transcriptional repressor of nem operon